MTRSPKKTPEGRREVLLDTAAQLFGTGGYENTSMRDIARAFGVLPGSLYHHFQSKEALFVAVYAKGVDRLLEQLERAAAAHTDPWDRLEAACVAHLQALLDRRGYAAAVIADWPGDPGPLREQLVWHRDRYESAFGALVDALPPVAGVDRRYLRLGLLGALNWTLTWYRPGGQSPDTLARGLLTVFRTAQRRESTMEQ